MKPTPEDRVQLEEIARYMLEYGYTSPDDIEWLRTKLREAWDENDKLLDALFDSFSQACTVSHDPCRYDHSCISTYEYIQEILISYNKISEDECVRGVKR